MIYIDDDNNDVSVDSEDDDDNDEWMMLIVDRCGDSDNVDVKYSFMINILDIICR